jgi:hypothetical protein
MAAYGQGIGTGSIGAASQSIPVPGVSTDLRIAVERLEMLNTRLHGIADKVCGTRPETAEGNPKHASDALKYQSQEIISLLDRTESLVSRIEQGL